jgi:hypothetical protein
MTKAIDVPDYILDMVPECANSYVELSRERLMPNVSDEVWADFIQNRSTHRLADSSERRKVHQAVLEEIAKRGLVGERPERPLLIYVCGPKASGKTTLLEGFQQRILKEKEQGVYEEYEATSLERFFQKYKAASAYCMMADFQLFKDSLPEFAQSGGEYAVIRAEAAGLNEACKSWAEELGACVIIEQLGYGGINQEVLKKNERRV